ncbi:MAG: hypothetical protein Fur009_7640 [Candidatus Microgenomates bacterium]
MINFNNKIKIVLILLFSFLGVYVFSPIIFLANTPKINPKFIASIKKMPENIINYSGKLTANIGSLFYNPFYNNQYDQNQVIKDQNTNILKPVQLITPPSYLQFKPVSKYVEAAEDAETGKKYIKIKKGARLEVDGEIEINGKKYPKIKIIEE